MISLVSYRGPGMSGGVSSALTALWRSAGSDAKHWFYICSKSNKVRYADSSGRVASGRSIPVELVDAHYRYCNEFIWPVMHDLGEYVSLNPEDRAAYVRFNNLIADSINTSYNGNQSERVGSAERSLRSQRHSHHSSDIVFIQDYQLALVANDAKGEKQIFWHIPWPKRVAPEHVPYVKELALGLLACRSIGFHTEEYASNFVRFVSRYLADFRIRYASPSTTPRRIEGNTVLVDSFGSSSKSGACATIIDSSNFGFTKILVAPLGLDLDHWGRLADSSNRFEAQLESMGLQKHGYILSVDRADYTKGVSERLRGIDMFFERNPGRIGSTRFVQICGKTRAGLSAFDNYWKSTRELADEVNQKWATDSWAPILWLDAAVNPELLAGCYRNARVMLVNPVRDGLNLTAKEFIACQDADPGVLALSPGAGVWNEIGHLAVPVEPDDPAELARSVEVCLDMPLVERVARKNSIQRELRANTLADWCALFSKPAEKTIFARNKRSHYSAEHALAAGNESQKVKG